MANRKWDRLQTIGHDRKIVAGSFAPNGGGAVAASSVKGSGILAVSRSAQGVFDITVDKYPDLESAVGTVQSGATLLHMQTVSYTASTGVVQLRLVDAAGVAQDLAANANHRVNFRFVFRNSSRR